MIMAAAGARARGRVVNRADLATFLGVSPPTVDAWIRRGMPFRKRGDKGRAWEFDTAEVVDWLREEEARRHIGEQAETMTLDQAKQRREVANAQLAELELAERLRTVIKVDDVAATVREEYQVVRQLLLSIPGRLAQELAAEADAAAVERALRDAIAEALEELSADDGAGIDDDDG
ncbi:MAG: Enterobacter phage Arya [Planctomycetota bacterium]|jgi:phage terminase Nu1 subunit (DNA packaging protein)